MLKNLHINIPFVEVMERMPNYTKFMKELLSKKRQLEADEIVPLIKKCSTIIQRKLPPELKDLGSFPIPCTISDLRINKALCDHGASINLISLSLVHKLGITKVKLIKVSL